MTTENEDKLSTKNENEIEIEIEIEIEVENINSALSKMTDVDIQNMRIRTNIKSIDNSLLSHQPFVKQMVGGSNYHFEFVGSFAFAYYYLKQKFISYFLILFKSFCLKSENHHRHLFTWSTAGKYFFIVEF